MKTVPHRNSAFDQGLAIDQSFVDHHRLKQVFHSVDILSLSAVLGTDSCYKFCWPRLHCIACQDRGGAAAYVLSRSGFGRE